MPQREIDRTEAERTMAAPEMTAPRQPGHRVLMRRYFDASLNRQMLLRIVVEETADELVVVTVYRTSQTGKYLKGAST